MHELENNHQDLLHWVDTLANEIERDAIQNDREGDFVKKQVIFLQKKGLTKLTTPVEFGGSGASLATMMLAIERLAGTDASTALVIGWHLGLIYAIRETGAWPEEDFYELCTQTVSGAALINACATEPATGSTSRGGVPNTTALPTQGGYVMNGEKNWATGSPSLSHILITAFLPDENMIGEFLVREGMPGLRHMHAWDSMSLRGYGSDTLVFEDFKLPASALMDKYPIKGVGKRNGAGGGWLLHIPAMHLGIAMAARNYTIDYASQYQPDSLQAPISTLATVRQHIGRLEAMLIPARHYLYEVAVRYDRLPLERRENLSHEIQLAKHLVTNTAIKAVDQAMRIAGGHSLLRHAPLERYYRDVRAGVYNPSMDDITLQELADHALKERLARRPKQE